MNPNNYASLAASKRLADNGIVLETDHFYRSYMILDDEHHDRVKGDIPAPSMAEVWRELPPGTELHKAHSFTEAFNFADTENADSIYPPCNSPDNPTDALIDLLIWVRKEKGHERQH
jgi:hypothetical protein